MHYLSEDSGGVTVVEGILSILQKTSVRIEWISRLQYGSAEIFAGQTWLSATLNGDSILAFLPEHGVFRIQDRIFFLLRIFPLATLDSFGMPCTAIPKSFTPQERLVKVDYPELKNVVVLWPSFRAERGETVEYQICYYVLNRHFSAPRVNLSAPALFWAFNTCAVLECAQRLSTLPNCCTCLLYQIPLAGCPPRGVVASVLCKYKYKYKY